MKNKIAFGLCATGLGIASIGMMGLSSEGQAGFILAVNSYWAGDCRCRNYSEQIKRA